MKGHQVCFKLHVMKTQQNKDFNTKTKRKLYIMTLTLESEATRPDSELLCPYRLAHVCSRNTQRNTRSKMCPQLVSNPCLRLKILLSDTLDHRDLLKTYHFALATKFYQNIMHLFARRKITETVGSVRVTKPTMTSQFLKPCQVTDLGIFVIHVATDWPLHHFFSYLGSHV